MSLKTGFAPGFSFFALFWFSEAAADKAKAMCAFWGRASRIGEV